jgi:hypothetical protein
MAQMTPTEIAQSNEQFKQQIDTLTKLNAVGFIGIGINFTNRDISCVINPHFPIEKVIELLESTINNLKNGN